MPFRPFSRLRKQDTVLPPVSAPGEHLPVGLYRSTLDGRILYANPAFVALLGADPLDEIYGLHLGDTGYPRAGFLERMEEDGQVCNLVVRWTDRSGRKRLTRETAVAVKDESGEVLYFEGVIEDLEPGHGRRTAEPNERKRAAITGVESSHVADAELAGCTEIGPTMTSEVAQTAIAKVELEAPPEIKEEDITGIDRDDNAVVEGEKIAEIELDDIPEIDPDDAIEIDPADAIEIDPDDAIEIDPDDAIENEPNDAIEVERDDIPEVDLKDFTELDPDDVPDVEPAEDAWTLDNTPEPDQPSARIHLDDRPSILVVEDNPDTRMLVDRIVRQDYNVWAVADARAALASMNERRFDVLVLDINLGGRETGVDVLRIGRTLPGYENVFAIALTAYALPGDRERFLRAGFDQYVAKPFTRKILMEALAEGMSVSAA